MEFWPWWMGALALGTIPLLHWLLLGRTLAVSGRFTALVDRLRSPSELRDDDSMSAEEMAEALREMVAVEYGEDALEEAGSAEAPALRAPQTTSQHLVFLAGLALGGLASALLASSFAASPTLRAEIFAEIAGTPGAAVGMLFFGGLLIGFGTRMAGGCTSGHGLCGVSRVQPGSLAATAAFFGTGIVVSLLLGALR